LVKFYPGLFQHPSLDFDMPHAQQVQRAVTRPNKSKTYERPPSAAFFLAGIGKKFGHWQGKLVCDDYGGTDFFDIPFLKNPFNLRQYCALLNCNVFCFL
jgi:hypothetical protein